MVVLLHNGNFRLSTTIAHSVHLKETYEDMDLLLNVISYSKYGRKICGDFKVVGLLLFVMQSGYTKFCCFLCEWDSRAKDKYYKIRNWPKRENSVPGQKCVRNQPLVDKDKIFFTATTH